MHPTINAIIVDDEPASRSLITELLRLNSPEVKVVGQAPNIEIALQLLEEHSVDLLFLDIEMPYGSGFDLLKRLPNRQFEVIFITGYDQYALNAIKVQALDYLLKPLDEEELKEAVNRAIQRIHGSEKDLDKIQQLLATVQPSQQGLQSISIHTREKILFIRLNEILYLKAEGACTFYFLKSGKRILSTKPLGKSLALLPAAINHLSCGFYRTHSSYAANLFYVQEFDKKGQCLILATADQVPVSQSKKEQLIKLLS